MIKIPVIFCLLLCSLSVLAQDRFSSVEERMTGKEFKETGLHKLSDEELNALNDWLRGHSVATLDNAVVRRDQAASPAGDPVADTRGFEGGKVDTNTIVSRLVGEFDGWDGETIFTLENGMIWKQNETDIFSIRTLVNPVVTIKSGMWSSWRLSVEEYNKSVKVQRIQ